MTTFQARVKEAMGPRGYENCMRRSVQSVILYEAHRCIADRLPSLRPFQRKLAFMDQCRALIRTINLLPHQREEIMWRTGTSKEQMLPETAWKRMKLIEKELEKLQEKIQPFCDGQKSHAEVCDSFIQNQYESVSGQKGKAHPPHWEHAHNNVIMAYRIYYKNGEIDPTFPPAVPAKDIIVPAQKPKSGVKPYYLAHGEGTGGDIADGDDDGDVLDAIVGSDTNSRLLVLKEVREHLDILKEMEGAISPEELNRRKRELFMALPPAPPPALEGKGKREESPASPLAKKQKTETDV